MPLVEISIVAGRPPSMVRDLIHQVHAAVRDSLDAPDGAIRVLVHEIPPEHWAAGDITKAEQETSQ
ncbi:tautomerase family protein [Streptomyces sp. NBC_00554]|uniref:tautomerase family protein n=1 Tax=Streptomyces sp. NBC_00554 TaxID=2903661 RepID=UPI00352E1234|nr:tautomerase family protein [Streptomyces sp. NBC_00554]